MDLIRRLGRRKNKTGYNKQSYGLFICPYCKEKVEIQLGHGRRQQSCGRCKYIISRKRATTHGEINTRLYGIWASMKYRCSSPIASNYLYFGDKGIAVCKDWLNYTLFRDWALANGYKEDLQIHRKNSNKNYEPDNCIWVTQKEHTKITFNRK